MVIGRTLAYSGRGSISLLPTYVIADLHDRIKRTIHNFASNHYHLTGTRRAQAAIDVFPD